MELQETAVCIVGLVMRLHGAYLAEKPREKTFAWDDLNTAT